MSFSIDDIARVFEQRGDIAYSGEAVTQTEHALQTAWLAQQDDAREPLVVASFLHDLGHIVHDSVAAHDSPTLRGVDDLHQYIALPFLRQCFGEEVLEPIRLHVEAKRYLCAVRPGYAEALSSDSRRSLVLQGGIFNAGDAQAFIARAWAPEAVRLRLWDDAAKIEGLATPPIATYLQLADRIAKPRARMAHS